MVMNNETSPHYSRLVSESSLEQDAESESSISRVDRGKIRKDEIPIEEISKDDWSVVSGSGDGDRADLRKSFPDSPSLRCHDLSLVVPRE